jgi:hypothetical protein
VVFKAAGMSSATLEQLAKTPWIFKNLKQDIIKNHIEKINYKSLF